MIILNFILALLLTTSLAWAEKEGKGAFRQGMKAKHQEFRSEMKSENRAFIDSMKDKSPEEKKAAMVAHRDEEHAKRMEFNGKMYEERQTELKKRLAGNSKLTDDQKNELVSFYEQQHQDAVAHREGQFNENKSFFEQIANDASLTQEQRKAAIKEHFATQKSENKAFRKDMHEENKSERKKIREEVKPKLVE